MTPARALLVALLVAAHAVDPVDARAKNARRKAREASGSPAKKATKTTEPMPSEDDDSMYARMRRAEEQVKAAGDKMALKRKKGAKFDGMPPRVMDQDLYAGIQQRKASFKANGYEWPVRTKFVGWPPQPNGSHTEEYLRTRTQLASYFKKVAVSSHHQVDAWDNLVASMVLPRFSARGFMLRAAEGELRKTWELLRKNYQKQKKKAPPEQWDLDLHSKDGVDYRPKFVNNKAQQKLNDLVLKQLHPMMEAWCGVELAQSTVYGLRIYGNGSTLSSHTDKPTTHVISAILVSEGVFCKMHTV
jgi:hypothetical protein